MQKNGETEIEELKRIIKEQTEFIQLQKDAIQFRERRLGDLKAELNVTA